MLSISLIGFCLLFSCYSLFIGCYRTEPVLDVVHEVLNHAGDDLPALSGALVVRSIPLYILRSPYKGGTTYKRGRADTTCGAAENPLLTAVFRRLSSRHHLVAVGSINCSHSMQHPVVKSLCFCCEEFILLL